MNEGIARASRHQLKPVPTVDPFVGAGFSRRVREAHD
jgi:hypothetical protein